MLDLKLTRDIAKYDTSESGMHRCNGLYHRNQSPTVFNEPLSGVLHSICSRHMINEWSMLSSSNDWWYNDNNSLSWSELDGSSTGCR